MPRLVGPSIRRLMPLIYIAVVYYLTFRSTALAQSLSQTGTRSLTQTRTGSRTQSQSKSITQTRTQSKTFLGTTGVIVASGATAMTGIGTDAFGNVYFCGKPVFVSFAQIICYSWLVLFGRCYCEYGIRTLDKRHSITVVARIIKP